MLEQRRFLIWKTNDPTGRKPPISPYKQNQPDTWVTFEEAAHALRPDQEIGFCFFESEDFHAIDLDHIRNSKTGEICYEAKMIFQRFNSLVDVSHSGTGAHIYFKGKVDRYNTVWGGPHIEFWPVSSPRYFALTGIGVEGYNTLRDHKGQFEEVASNKLRHEKKLHKELQELDPEQFAAQYEGKPDPFTIELKRAQEKIKTKTRVVKKDFDLLAFYDYYTFKVLSTEDNDIGHCVRIDWCPIKGEPHAHHGPTSTNFIYPCKDGGLAFECHSTDCEARGDVSMALAKLEEKYGPYPPGIYEEKPKNNQAAPTYTYALYSFDEVEEECLTWLWPGCLPDNKLVNFMGAQAEGKSPVTIDLIARITTSADWPDGKPNTLGPRSVILLAGEDDLHDTIKPRLRVAGADLKKVHGFEVTAHKDDTETELTANMQRDKDGLMKVAGSLNDLALIVIDPITNYLGDVEMNKEEKVRQGLLVPLMELAKNRKICVIFLMHLNKRGEEATVFQRGMGAQAFTGLPRKVFLFGPDPHDSDQYAHVMKETRDKVVAIKYKTIAVPDPTGIQKSEVIQIEWGGHSDADADEIANAPKSRVKRNNKEAQDLMEKMFKDPANKGVVTSAAIEKALSDVGIVCPAWQRVIKRIPAKSRQIKGGAKNAGFEWYRPAPEQTEFDHVS
jgi:hypothetical protein